MFLYLSNIRLYAFNTNVAQQRCAIIMCSLSVNINVHVSYIFVCLLNLNEATYFPSLAFHLTTSGLQLQPSTTSILTSDHSFEHSPCCSRLSSSLRLTSLTRVTSPIA